MPYGPKPLGKHATTRTTHELHNAFDAAIEDSQAIDLCVLAECNRIFASPSRHTLEQHFTVSPTFEPIVSKPVVINFDKHTLTNLTHIFAPKFTTTLKRFNIFEILGLLNVNTDNVAAIFKLHSRIAHLDRMVKDISDLTTQAEWRHWECGLKKIGSVSSKGLCRNWIYVFKALRVVWNNKYFD